MIYYGRKRKTKYNFLQIQHSQQIYHGDMVIYQQIHKKGQNKKRSFTNHEICKNRWKTPKMGGS